MSYRSLTHYYTRVYKKSYFLLMSTPLNSRTLILGHSVKQNKAKGEYYNNASVDLPDVMNIKQYFYLLLVKECFPLYGNQS